MPHRTNLCYEFGPYCLNVAQRVLTRDGEAVSLTPKATEILVRLVMNAGQLLEKDDLLKEVWPDTFVEEANLTQNIFTLRRALGDERAGPKYIETVARRGYRFVASVKVHDLNEDSAATAESDEQNSARDNSAGPRVVVAVMPFINASGDEGLEYLAEGVTDNIINSLSRLSRLRVMSRSAVFRHRKTQIDPLQTGKALGAHAVLVGTVNAPPARVGAIHRRPAAITIAVELVDVATGWQLWGEVFDSQNKDLLQIQEAITRKLLANLKLKLTGEEEKRITARYTENADAYQAYLEGRYHWSRYTRTGIEKAIGHFRQAIELDPNYALAYAAIVDCYLRLATNYLPPEEYAPTDSTELRTPETVSLTDNPKLKLRFEWDWKGAERELRRAHELKIDYPAAHQWYAASLMSQQIYESSCEGLTLDKHDLLKRDILFSCVPLQIRLLKPTPRERVQVCCAIAREQIDSGNYDAACKVLQTWWRFGEWPLLDGLDQRSCGDLLFTAGELAGCFASTRQVPEGQKYGEALLNGSIAIFEQLSSTRRAIEGRIELALCYYRQGSFDLGRSTLLKAMASLSEDDNELRSLALIRLASLERHAGQINEALAYLGEALNLVESFGPWVRGRCYLELASSYMDLARSDENVVLYCETAKTFYLKAVSEFQAVGNHRLSSIVENNLGLLLLLTGNHRDAETHLLRARRSFDHFADRIRCAQVDDSLARLYVAVERYEEAQTSIERSVEAMETGDEDASLAESLTTKGLVCCKLGRFKEAQKALDEAYILSRRCGDIAGAGRAMVIRVEEMIHVLDHDEVIELKLRLTELLSTSPQSIGRRRVFECLQIINSFVDSPTIR